MKVVILAGGYGTRLAELTHSIPKPMVEIGGKPIIWHVMNSYAQQGFNEFIVALGYKSNVIKSYFYNYFQNSGDLNINLSDGSCEYTNNESLDWKVSLIETGVDSMTGGRVKRLEPHLNETFFLTYGDGLSNVNLQELLDLHIKQKNIITVTSINPTSKYGKLKFNKDEQVESFTEKPQFGGDWINGGFMAIEPSFIDYIDNDESILEAEPFQAAISINKFGAYKHRGFWKCMDTLRDRQEFEKICENNSYPWLNIET